MADPKTVREWLETLPEPYRTSAIGQMIKTRALDLCESISDAILCFTHWSSSKEGWNFWEGFRDYLMGRTIHECDKCFKGYTAAKAAFEAQQNPEPQQYANNKEIADALQSGSFSWAKIPTLPESEPSPVGYIAVAPDDHAELCRKADLYNECKAVIDRLSCEIEALKKRFV